MWDEIRERRRADRYGIRKKYLGLPATGVPIRRSESGTGLCPLDIYAARELVSIPKPFLMEKKYTDFSIAALLREYRVSYWRSISMFQASGPFLWKLLTLPLWTILEVGV